MGPFLNYFVKESLKLNIFFVNHSNAVSMSLYAARLWQYLKAIQPEWECGSMSPFKEMIADQPNRYLRNFSDFIINPLFLKWGLRKNKYDLFHVIDHSYAYLASNFPKEKTVITCHDLMMYKVLTGEIGIRKNQAKFKLDMVKRNIDRIKKIAQAARIIAVSNNTKQDLIKYLDIEDKMIDVVFSGLNYDFYPIEDDKKQMVRRKYGFKKERLILCVGNNQFYKNLEGIIEALAMKIDYLRRNNLVLVKTGSDFSVPQKKMIEKYGLRSHVIYMGYVSSFDHLNDLYNLAEIFLFPSLYEGFGWPPLEAMACGTPVIASGAGSLKEVLLDAAFTIDPDNHEQIAQAIRTVLEDKALRYELIRKGIANAARFDWKQTAIEYAQLYNKIFEINYECGK